MTKTMDEILIELEKAMVASVKVVFLGSNPTLRMQLTRFPKN